MADKFKKRKAQVWVEAVIYTLVAFVLIGIVLSFVKPKINDLQDQAIIEQNMDALERIDSQLLSIKEVPGNQRSIELEVKKGNLVIDGINDTANVIKIDSIEGTAYAIKPNDR